MVAAAIPASTSAIPAESQNFIGRSSSETPLWPYAQHDQEQAESDRRCPRGAEEREHDRLGDAEDQAGDQRAAHAAEARQHHDAEGAADVDAVEARLDRADHGERAG